MQDFYLKFNDELEANSILYTTTEEQVDADGVVIQEKSVVPNFKNIDVLGTIFERPVEPVPVDYVPVALPGWHVNVRVIDNEDSTALQPFSVVPTNPRRVWA